MRFKPLHARFAAVALLFTASAALAQPAQKPFEPFSGQAGKDVVWVPTPQALVDKMLDMAKVTPKRLRDRPRLRRRPHRDHRRQARRARDRHRIQPRHGRAVQAQRRRRPASAAKPTSSRRTCSKPISRKATVITMFLLPDINLKLRPKILDLKPGTRIVSNTFTMGEWKDDETATVDEAGLQLLLHRAPVDRAGQSRRHVALPQGELTLKQEFQMVAGLAKSGGDTQIDQQCKAARRSVEFQRRRRDLYRPRQWQHDRRHGHQRRQPRKWTATRR